MANIGNRFVRWILWLSLGVFLLLATCLVFLQTTYAKDFLTKVILDFVVERTGYQISLDEIQIDWFDRVSVSNFRIVDSRDSLMLWSSASTINYSISTLISSSKLQVDDVSIQDGELNLYKHTDSTSINLLDFIIKLGQRDTASKGRSVSVSSLEFKRFRMTYKDLKVANPTDSIFHPNYFSFDISRLSASDLELSNDTLSVAFDKMTGKEIYSGLPISHFQSDFHLFPTAIVLENTLIETERSSFRDSIALSFSKPGNLAYFKDSVKMDIRLKQSLLDIRDLQFFGNVPYFSERLILDGALTGYLANLDLKNFSIGLQSGENVAFDASLFGLPSLNETFLDLEVKEAVVQEYLLNLLIPGANERIDQVKFKGAIIGFLRDFVVYGDVSTSFGSVETDINLKLSESPVKSVYSGSFAFEKYRMGELLGINGLQEMDFNGSIKGQGFSAETADFRMNATINNLKYEDYTYDSLGLIGQFKASFFDGEIGFNDERGKLHGSATIDFSRPKEVVSVDLKVDSIDLKAFSLTAKEAWYSSDLSADLNEVDIDVMTGTVTLSNVDIRTPETFLILDTIELSSDHSDVKKRYELKSDIIDALVTGDFKILELVEDLPAILKSFTAEFIVEESDSLFISPDIDYQSEFEFQIKSLNPLLRLLDLPVSISDGSEIEFQFRHQSDVSFNLFAAVDTIKFYNKVFYQNELQVDASKGISSKEVLALLQFSSSAQSWNDEIGTKSLSLEAIWDQNVINSFFKIAQPENENRANIKSITKLKKDTIDFKVLPSNILFFNTAWNVNRNNQIQLFRDKLIIDQLELYKGNQLVSLDGALSDSSLTSLNFRFEEFDLFTLSTLSPRPFGGIVNATGRLSRLNGEQPLRIETDIEVDDLSFEGIPIGDLKGISSWDRSVNGLFVDYSITRENIETIDLSGYIKPFQEDQLDVQVSFDKAKLDLLEPLFETLISDLDGTATGQLNLTGLISRPKLRGISTINKGAVTIDYLNTAYSFSGVTRFFEEQIAFDNIVIMDRFQNSGALNGAINHNQFQDVELNVAMNFDKFELLNTNSQLNSLYYGNAFASGTMDLRGPLENILISAEATSTANTRVFIPLIEENTAQQGSFIKFKSKVDSSVVLEDEIDLSGINIDFDMDITPDAYIELIFNPRTGDIIRGRGEGNLQLTVNSSGDFDLFGGYAVSEGAYNFTTSLINKEFQLVPGGVINWFGDPYQGQLDMTATYRQLADIQDWNPNDSTSPRSMVNVNLEMQGSMLTPEIGFKLELDDQNSADPRWNQVIATINSEEEELKRQVFSLLILRKFSQRAEFLVGGNTLSTGLSSSVSEFVSNQLSYWLNQVYENLEIDFDINFDINSLSADAFNTFQLRLAYSFLDGRLRVTRGGGVTTIVEEGAGSDLQGILGDWSVEYVLTEDGKWRARFFSRNNQYNSTAQQLQETGLSLQYVTSFDEFKEILKSGRKSG